MLWRREQQGVTKERKGKKRGGGDIKDCSTSKKVRGGVLYKVEDWQSVLCFLLSSLNISYYTFYKFYKWNACDLYFFVSYDKTNRAIFYFYFFLLFLCRACSSQVYRLMSIFLLFNKSLWNVEDFEEAAKIPPVYCQYSVFFK